MYLPVNLWYNTYGFSIRFEDYDRIAHRAQKNITTKLMHLKE